MKIPKYIDDALIKRRKAALKLMDYDGAVTDFIEKNQIDVNSEDYAGGVEMYSNPYDSEKAVRQAILNHDTMKWR